MSWQPSPLCISFGLSPLLLGVTKSPRYCDQDTAVGSPLWVSPTHLIEESIDLHCKSVHLRNIANSSRVELANDILWSFQAANHRWLVLVLLHMQGHFMTIERVTNSQPVESRVELPFSHPPDYGVMHMVFAPYNPNELVVGLEKANVAGRVMFIVLDIEKTQSTGAACVLTNLCYDFVVARFFVIRLSTWTMDWTPCPLIVTFGISPLLLGVTRSPRLLRQESPGLPLWVSPNHQIEESINPATSLMSLYLKNSAARSRVELITEIGWSFQAVNHRWLVLVRLGRKPDCPVQDDFMTIERVTDFQPVESRVELPFSHPSNYNIIRMMFTKSKPNELVVGLENARVESRVMFLVLDIEKTHSTGRTCILTNICYDFISGPLLTILPMRNRSGARSFISGVWDPRPGVHKFYNVTEGVPASLQINSSHTRLEASRISDSLFAVWLFKPTGFLSTYQVWDCSDTTAPVREVPQPEKSTLLSITAEGGFLVRVFEHHIDVVEAMTEFPVLVVEILGRQAMSIDYHDHF
ncbi:hypothetical protein Pelo_7864 [Pelomyxa schiedti]|nr:hypothetical protein Pelo_7864 [Pelomyxa schiedti]